MKSWWVGLAPRERMLVTVAGVLLVLVLFWQFVLLPTQAAKAKAQEQLANSSQTLSRLQESYMALRATGGLAVEQSAQLAASTEAFKTSVTRSATDKGLSISRLQGGDGAAVRLVFDRADPRTIFFWLEEVETTLGGRVSHLTMEQVDGGAVRVNVDLEGASG